MTVTIPEEKQEVPRHLDQRLSSRDRLLAALDIIEPLTKEEAEMINKSITEARERSIGENLSSRHRHHNRSQ